MSLPKGIPVKLGLYTLACHELLNRLRDLREATLIDLRVGYDTCLRRFDEELRVFFERSSANDLRQATKQFGDALYAQANYFRDSNPRAAAVIDDVVAAMHEQAAAWHYQTDLERLHLQGCELARRFFAHSPWSETQKRLDNSCYLTVEYGLPASNDRIAGFAEPFGYSAAPLAYYPEYWDDECESSQPNLVIARFSFSHDFTLYLAYPFLFLHEYTAHVYATDHGNERFSDGWMLHAASVFLKREWIANYEQLDLSLEQADIFYERLYYTLNDTPGRACSFARRFDDWLSAQLPERFTQITYELAAFQPGPRTPAFWPTQFINTLEREFITDRERLHDKICASASAQ